MIPPSITLIESRQPNNPIGTGFVIHHTADHTYILTCAHVVRDMGGKDQVNAATLPAEVIAIGEDNGLDLAVLRVAQLTERPPLRLCAGGNPGQAVQIEGYYKYVSFRALEAITGRLAKSFTLSDTGHTHYEPAWYVTIDDHEKLLGGYSGSPVCDSGTGAVLGVMITSDGEQQGRAISINALTRIWPEMPAGLLGAGLAPQPDTAHPPPESHKPSPAPTPTERPRNTVNVYLAAHQGLCGAADGLSDEVIIDWAQEFLNDDPEPEIWERLLLPDLKRNLRAMNRDDKKVIKLRAFARNSAGLAFGHIFCERAGFQIHYVDSRGGLWCTDEAGQVESPLICQDTIVNEAGRDLLLELAVTQGADSVKLPVDEWLHTSLVMEQRDQNQASIAGLRRLLTDTFNDSELRNLCFDFGVDYENLSGPGKSDKVRELMLYVGRHTRSTELIAICRHLRPNADWGSISQPNLPQTAQMPLVHKRLLLTLERKPLQITPIEGVAIARQICELVSGEGRPGGTVHLFGALPLAVLVMAGWGLKAGRAIQCYELNQQQQYKRTCLLRL